MFVDCAASSVFLSTLAKLLTVVKNGSAICRVEKRPRIASVHHNYRPQICHVRFTRWIKQSMWRVQTPIGRMSIMSTVILCDVHQYPTTLLDLINMEFTIVCYQVSELINQKCIHIQMYQSICALSVATSDVLTFSYVWQLCTSVIWYVEQSNEDTWSLEFVSGFV